LTFCRCCLAFFVCVNILLRFLIISIFNNNVNIIFHFVNKVKELFYKIIITILPFEDIFSPILLATASNTNDSNPNSNHNPNSNPDPNEDSDLEKQEDVIENPDYNAPEQIRDDLDLLDKAKQGDEEALAEIKRQYPEFFRDNDDEQGLLEVEEYLEEEFQDELGQAELEANNPNDPGSTNYLESDNFLSSILETISKTFEDLF
jgi:hypothetical protein